MRSESKMIKNDEISSNIVENIKQYVDDLLNEFDDSDVIKITSIKVDISNGNVFIMYNDYTEDKDKLQKVILDVHNVKLELDKELSKKKLDGIKIVVLQNKLNKLVDEFNKLKRVLGISYELYDVI